MDGLDCPADPDRVRLLDLVAPGRPGADPPPPKVRILPHFDPQRLPWSELASRFQLSYWAGYDADRRKGRKPDMVVAVGHLPVHQTADYRSLPRERLSRLPCWHWPNQDGCPLNPRENCSTAGHVVCKMLRLQDTFGWHPDHPPADAGPRPAFQGDLLLPPSRHLHFLLSADYTGAQDTTRERTLEQIWKDIPPSHHFLLPVEASTPDTDEYHMHVHNASMLSGSWEEDLDGRTASGFPDLANTARREMLEETGVWLQDCPATMFVWSSTMRKHRPIDIHGQQHPPGRTEVFLLVDITDSQPPPASLVHPRVHPRAWDPDRLPAGARVSLPDGCQDAAAELLYQLGGMLSQPDGDPHQLLVRDSQTCVAASFPSHREREQWIQAAINDLGAVVSFD